MNMTIKIIHVGLIALCLGIVNSASDCDTNIYLEVGKQGTVHCRFQDFQILGWINGDGHHGETIPFIYLENSVKKGRGYDSGDYDILPDGSLIINNVQLKHEFNFSVSYTPIVGRTMLAFVPVSVYVRPSPEYPVVNGVTNQQYIYQEVEFYSGSINCLMNGVRPRVDLEWVYQSDVISMENESSSVTNNTDGTYSTWLSSRYTIRDRSVLKITLQCRVAGGMQDLFPSVTTIYLLNLNRHFPVVNGEANQQHLVLQLNREDEVTCSLDRVLQGVSLEWVILSPKDEVMLDSEISKIINGDGTFNITLRAKLIETGPSVHHVILQCGVSGPAGDMYSDVTTVEVLLAQNFPIVNGHSSDQHVVLHLNREDELTCSVDGVSADVSLEWVIITPGQIELQNEHSEVINEDGTFTVTLTTHFSILSNEVQHVTMECRVTGQRADQHKEGTTVELLVSESTASVFDHSEVIRRWRWSFALTIILNVAVIVILLVLFRIILVKLAKKHVAPDPENGDDIAMKAGSHRGSHESLLELGTQPTAADVKEMYATIISLLNNPKHSTYAGSSFQSSDSAIA